MVEPIWLACSSTMRPMSLSLGAGLALHYSAPRLSKMGLMVEEEASHIGCTVTSPPVDLLCPLPNGQCMARSLAYASFTQCQEAHGDECLPDVAIWTSLADLYKAAEMEVRRAHTTATMTQMQESVQL